MGITHGDNAAIVAAWGPDQAYPAFTEKAPHAISHLAVVLAIIDKLRIASHENQH